MKKIFTILTFLLFLPYNITYADDLEILCCSYHFNRNGQNEINPGVIYNYNLNDTNMITGGIFKNSYSNTSLIIGYTHKWNFTDNLSASLTGGLRTGYPDDGKWPKWLAVMPTVEYKRIKIHVTPGFVGLGVKVWEW